MARSSRHARYQHKLSLPLNRIPKQLTLPFGYRITIIQLPDQKMDELEPECDGLWDADIQTIYIRKNLPITRQRYILAHELGHAWLDWQHYFLDDGKAKI